MQLSSFNLLASALVVSLAFSSVSASFDTQTPLERYFATDFDEDWSDLTVGMMMRKDDNSTDLTKRSTQRESSLVHIKRDRATGKLKLPRSWQHASRMIQRHVKRGAKSCQQKMSVVITWYTGHDLLNPACVQGGSGWAPTDESLAAAVTIAWDGKPACGKFVKIQHHTDKKKYVVVRIVDSCGGCASGSAHIDLTKTAFEKLYPMDVGIMSNLKAQVVNAPQGIQWTEADIALYGPKSL